MHSTDFERPETKTRAIEEALGRLGEPITEGQARDSRPWKIATARTACSRWPRPAGICLLARDLSPRSE